MNKHSSEIASLSANTQAMGLPEFLADAYLALSVLDDAMSRMSKMSREQIREQLERSEDDFLARKEMEARGNESFLHEVKS